MSMQKGRTVGCGVLVLLVVAVLAVVAFFGKHSAVFTVVALVAGVALVIAAIIMGRRQS